VEFDVRVRPCSARPFRHIDHPTSSNVDEVGRPTWEGGNCSDSTVSMWANWTLDSRPLDQWLALDHRRDRTR
jgi:hypothetical protein